MTRILFIAPTHNVWGGMEQWLHNFTSWLQTNTDWDVRAGLVWGARHHDPDKYLAAHPHLCPQLIDVRIGTESARRAELVHAIESLQPDLIVPILSGPIFPAVATAKARGSHVRFVVPVRSLLPELFVNIEDFLPVIDGVVAISRLFHGFLLQRHPEERERIHYVRHGARAAESPHDGTRFGSDAPLRVAYVGRLEQPAKRVLDLVPLARELERHGTPVELHLFGAGAEEGRLRNELATTSLPVSFHGFRSQAELYTGTWPHLDVVTLFSDSEGTPNVLCEAMQHGVVPVASRYPGQAAEAFVVDGVNGFTFPVGDVTAAARTIHALAADRALLERLSRAASEQAALDTAERMHRDWLRIFETTLQLPQKRGPVTVAPPPPAGRLDRLLTSAGADRVRKLLRKYKELDYPSEEWPVTHAADPQRVRDVDKALET